MAAVLEFLLAVAQAVLMLWLVRWCPELALAEVDGEVRQIPRSDKPSCASSYAPECLASPCYIFCRLPTLLYFLPLRSCEKTPTLDLWAYPFRKVSGTVSLRMFINVHEVRLQLIHIWSMQAKGHVRLKCGVHSPTSTHQMSQNPERTPIL